MSEPQPPTSAPQSKDPLLESDSYIDPAGNDSEAEPLRHHGPAGIPEFAPGEVIVAEPISMYLPDEGSPEAAPRQTRRRNAEEMSKRPSWLPENWTIDLRVRSSGATAGLIDRYYIEPSGQRKFRSKNEVLHFLETGDKPKRKLTSETDTGASASPASQKQKKSGTKRQKSEALNSDVKHSPHANGVQADTRV